MKERKQSRKYIIFFAVIAFLCLTAIAGLTFVIDPYFHYHMPWFGMETYVVDSERYSNPGLAKNADYDAIIVGSSMSENFNGEWFDESYDINTVKLTYSGCSVQDWVNAVTMAEQNQNIKYVFSNIDIGMLSYEYGMTKSELPEYLYDNNYFNDVYYLFNKDTFFHIMSRIQNNYIGNLKNAYAWYNDHKAEFGHQNVIKLRSYNGEIKNIEQKKENIDDNTIKVIAQIKETILKNPETLFELFYSPYSILYFYESAMNGEMDKLMEIYQYSIKELLECENCKLYFPAYNNIEMIADLDSYKDLGHYDIEIQYTIFEEMRDGVNRVTKDNYEDIIKWFRDEIINYNYKELYEKYD